MKIRCKKITMFFLAVFFVFEVSVGNFFAQDISVSAKSAILMCADSGSVLFCKNENDTLPMASTTKIMTALLTLECMEACGNKEVEITDEMIRVEGTSMGLMQGDIVNLEALCKGMLLCSGNDAANAAAIAVSGNTSAFISLMNEKAKMIGMTNTKFSTPSGLDKDNHHSSAKDMAVLGAYAMENENFSKIVSQKSMKVNFINPGKSVNIKNHNKLLRLYNGCIGIKTGFTKSAGRCLVSCAEKNGIKLICVTLNAPNDWDDHSKLYDFGFENTVLKNFDEKDFKISIPIKNADVSAVEAKGASEFSLGLKKGDETRVTREVQTPEFLDSSVERGQIVGKVVYCLDGKTIGKNNLISTAEVKSYKPFKRNIFNILGDFFKKIFGIKKGD